MAAGLVVTLELQQQAFQKGMDTAARSLAKMQQSAKGTEKALNQLESGFKTVAAAAAAAATVFGAFKGVEQLVKSADQVRNLHGSFTALLGSTERASDMLQKVFGVVERTGVPLEAAAGAAQRLTIALRDLGASNRQIETISETFIQLGKVGGASATETASALQQLGQALASGKLGGDELRSIRENAPLVADAIAKSMGVTSGALKQLGEDGKLTADVVANALLQASDKAQAAFNKLPVSLEQALNKMNAAAIVASAQFDKVSGLSTTLVTTTDSIAANLKRWSTELDATNERMNQTQGIAYATGLAVRLIAAAFVAINFGVEAISRRLVFIAQQIQLMLEWDWAGVVKHSDQFRKDLEAAAAAADATITALLKGQALVKPKTSSEEETGGQPTPTGTKIKPGPPVAGDHKGKSEAEREAEALKKRGEALAASVSAQEAYNQKLREYDELLGKGAITQATFEKATAAAHEQLTAAGDAMRASVDPAFEYELAMRKINQAYADGTIEIETWVALQEKAKEAMDKLNKEDPMKQLAENMAETAGKDIGQFFTDLIEGTISAAEAFNKMVKAIISDLAKLLAEFAAKEAAKFIIKSLFGGSSAGGKSAGPAPSAQLATLPTWNAAASLAPTALGSPRAIGAGSPQTGGVAAAASGPFNVVVNNNAAGVEVTTRETEGALEITVQRVRAMLSQDVMRGGNAFSRSLETAYALGRGR